MEVKAQIMALETMVDLMELEGCFMLLHIQTKEEKQSHDIEGIGKMLRTVIQVQWLYLKKATA